MSDQAIDWIVRLNSGTATAEDEEEFRAWRRLSIEHELAAQEAETVWHGVGIVGGELLRAEKKRGTTVTRRTVIGGGALVLAGAAVYSSGLLNGVFADYSTGTGEQRMVTLADGSSVFLNASSALVVSFTATERRLTLTRGQATFTVAHDPGRPFIVSASGGETRAVGTVFDIDIQSDQVVVTVLEGVVAVSEPERDPLRLEVDEQVRYGAAGASSPYRVDADSVTAWRRGMLVFNERRLDSVIAEIGRYRSGVILIANPRLSALEVTGVFELNDPEAVLTTIEQTLPVSVTRMPFVTIIR